MRRFNVTTTCVRKKHYMADVSRKIEKIINMIEADYYFTINRARQKGKSTILDLLEKELSEKYLVISASFEGRNSLFEKEESFTRNIFNVFAESFNILAPETASKIKMYGKDINTMEQLGEAISKMCLDWDKEIILFIDEVDKASNYYVFMDFLGMLRKKYISKQSNKDVSFKSVILTGVNDIKRIKVHINEKRILSEDEILNNSKIQFNSPWNVAEAFNVDLDLDIEEIQTLLYDYLSEHDFIKIDVVKMASEIHKYSSGYPYLVSKICKVIDEELNKDFTINGLRQAVKYILNESNTLFDDLIKNIENNKQLFDTVYSIIIENNSIQFNVDAHGLGIMYGAFKNFKERLVIHNKIFELRLYNYLIAKKSLEEIGQRITNYSAAGIYENSDGSLDIEKALLKYQEYMKGIYSKFDKDFIERQGRLLLLAFFKPILNGKGFYFVESQTGFEQRQDIVITYGKNKYIIELKVWRGEEYHKKGITQLKGYLEIENSNKGYLVIYNKNANKEYSASNIYFEGKELFVVFV